MGQAARKSSAGQTTAPKGKPKGKARRDEEIEKQIKGRKAWRGPGTPQLKEYLVKVAKAEGKEAACNINRKLVKEEDLSAWMMEYDKRGTLEKDPSSKPSGDGKPGRKSGNEKEIERLKQKNRDIQRKLMKATEEDPEEKVREFQDVDPFIEWAINELTSTKGFRDAADLYVDFKVNEAAD